MNDVQVDLSNWITDGFNLYKNNFGLLLIVTLIFALLSGVTLGILALRRVRLLLLALCRSV